jgi:hypothetical protein
MDQTTFQQAADLHPRPKLGGWLSCTLVLIKNGLHRRIRLVGVVIGDRELLQTHGQGLVGEGFGAQAAVTANRVAMEVEATGTAPRPYLPQHGGEGMVPVAIAPGLAEVCGQRGWTH